MQKIVYKANERPHRDMGWIQIDSSFDWHSPDPVKKHFGKLITLEDAIIRPGGQGFGMHPHQNLEVMSMVLSGVLSHKDSKGNIENLPAGGFQIITSGSGIMHSEFNHSASEPCEMLQIWILPKKDNVPPNYQRQIFSDEAITNNLTAIVSPDGASGSMKINQDAYIYYGLLESDQSFDYHVQIAGNGVYLFVLDGNLDVEGVNLYKRDRVGIKEAEKVSIKSKDKARVLLIEVPINMN